MVVQHFSADQSFSRNRQCSASAFSVVYNIKQYCYLPFHLHIYVYTIVSPIAKKERTLLLSLCSILLYIPTCIHDWAALFFLFLRYWQFCVSFVCLAAAGGDKRDTSAWNQSRNKHKRVCFESGKTASAAVGVGGWDSPGIAGRCEICYGRYVLCLEINAEFMWGRSETKPGQFVFFFLFRVTLFFIFFFLYNLKSAAIFYVLVSFKTFVTTYLSSK